jgi:hypothetical protein
MAVATCVALCGLCNCCSSHGGRCSWVGVETTPDNANVDRSDASRHLVNASASIEEVTQAVLRSLPQPVAANAISEVSKPDGLTLSENKSSNLDNINN